MIHYEWVDGRVWEWLIQKGIVVLRSVYHSLSVMTYYLVADGCGIVVHVHFLSMLSRTVNLAWIFQIIFDGCISFQI